MRAALGRHALGLYVYGSLTQGAFQPRRSDVDAIALLRGPLSAAQVRRLRAGLARLARKDPWTRRLQLTLVLKRELLQINGAGWVYQRGSLRNTGSDGNPIVWVNVRESGIALFGPAPRTFLPPITPARMDAALGRELGYLREELVSRRSSPWRARQSYRRYAVLTICRILFTRRTGRVVSKPVAAAWALRNLPPEHRGIVRRALGSRGRSHLALRPLRALLDEAGDQR